MRQLSTLPAFRVPVAALFAQIAISFSPACVAVEASPKPEVSIVAKASEKSDAAEQLAIARAQLADAKEFQSAVLDTVYWSLGTVAAVTILLTGFGWFANFRVYERDKESLEKGLNAMIAREVVGLRESINGQIDLRLQSHEATSRSALAELESRSLTAVQDRLDSSQKALLSEIASLVKSDKSISHRMLDIQLRLERYDHRSWIEKKVLSNALLSSVAMLRISISLEEEFFVSEALDRIREDVDAIAAHNPRLVDSYQRGELVAALERVRGINAQAASALVQRVAAVFG